MTLPPKMDMLPKTQRPRSYSQSDNVSIVFGPGHKAWLAVEVVMLTVLHGEVVDLLDAPPDHVPAEFPITDVDLVRALFSPLGPRVGEGDAAAVKTEEGVPGMQCSRLAESGPGLHYGL